MGSTSSTVGHTPLPSLWRAVDGGWRCRVGVGIWVYVSHTGAAMCRHRGPPVRQRAQHYGERGLRLPLLARQVAPQSRSRAAGRMDRCVTPPTIALLILLIVREPIEAPLFHQAHLANHSARRSFPDLSEPVRSRVFDVPPHAPHPPRPSRAVPTVSSQLTLLPHLPSPSTRGCGARCPQLPDGARPAPRGLQMRVSSSKDYGGLRSPRAQQRVLSALPSLIG